MSIRTVVAISGPGCQFALGVMRQCPGNWPSGKAVFNQTIFIPPVGERLLGDWLIVLTPPPDLFNTPIPRERRILFVQEPPEVWNPPEGILRQFGYIVSPYPLENTCGATVIRDVTTGLFWWYGQAMDGHRSLGRPLCFEEIAGERATVKSRLLSTITSSKTGLPGHRARLEFTLKLKETLGDDLHVFGHGINPVADKREALLPYRFHLAIENSVHPEYWSEKLSDPLLARCVVFYHGASDIARYFSSRSVVPINIHEPGYSIDIIRSHLERWSEVRDEIEESRNRVLHHYNFPIYVDRLIDAILEEERGRSRVEKPEFIEF